MAGLGQKMFDGPENYISFGKNPAKYRHMDGEIVSRVGKARSGRTLDGVTHDAFPEVPA